MKHWLAIISALSVLVSMTVMAQSEGEGSVETEIEEIPRYDVEIVIFKNSQVPKSREFILPVSSPTREEKIFDLSSAASVEAALELGYELLGSEDYRLIEVVTRLVDSNRYELLLHTGWRQPGVDRDKALPVWIKGGRIFGNEYTSIDNQIEFLESIPQAESPGAEGTTSYEFDEQSLESLELQLLEQQALQQHPGLYELEGKITVALSRYLHTYTDLVLRRPRSSVDAVPNTSGQDRYLAAFSEDTRILDNHLLREHRRMRSKNLHYLDNPEFSMLVLITPYEAAPEIEELLPQSDEVAE